MSPFSPHRHRGPDLHHFLTNGNTIPSPPSHNDPSSATSGPISLDDTDFAAALEDDLSKFTNLGSFTEFDTGAIDFGVDLGSAAGGGEQQAQAQPGGAQPSHETAGTSATTFTPTSANSTTTSGAPNPFDLNDFAPPPHHVQQHQHHQNPYAFPGPYATPPNNGAPPNNKPSNLPPTAAAAAASPTGAGPPLAPDARAAAEEDKRRRNTAASARFRVKKKEREKALEKSAEEYRKRVQELEGTVGRLREENQWLKDLLVKGVKERDGGDGKEGKEEGEGEGEGGERSTGLVKRGVGTEG